MANAMPSRSRRVVERLLENLSTWLEPGFAGMLPRLEQDLGRRAATGREPAMVDDWLASRRALADGRDAFFGLFMSALHQECMDAYSHALPAPASDPFPARLQPLRLLDDDIVDEESTLAAIASRQEAVATLPLMLLGQRFAVLLERPPLVVGTLPVGPRAMGRCLRQAATDTGLRLHSRLALYQHAEQGPFSDFPKLAEAMDALVDEAGILPGLSFVPLRRRSDATHPSRGLARQEPADAGRRPPMSPTAALRMVNGLLDQVAPAGSLPERKLLERREAVAALVRFLLHHGRDSEAWERGREVVLEVVAAARSGRELQAATAAWIRGQLALIGYAGDSLERLAVGIARMGVADGEGAGGVSSGSRQHRLRERLEQLEPGAVLAFTAVGGITRARLRGRGKDNRAVLLATDDGGQEAWVETEALARLMAEGSAWVVRNESRT
jgi:hypothetical protein